MPGSHRPAVALPALLVLLAGGLAGFTILRGIGPHDEGLVLAGAARVAHGQLPYRDFWTNYPPGQMLVLAGLDKVFGASLLHWRIVRVAIDAVVALEAYFLARREASQPVALLAWLAVAGAMAFPLSAAPNAPALALALGAVLAAPRRPGWAGVLAGLAVLFRIEIGLAAVLGVALAAPSGRRAVSAATGLAVGVVVLAPFVAIAPADMLDDTFGFLGKQHLQRLPFPLDFDGPVRPSKLIELYLPLILVVSSAAWALAALVRARTGGRDAARPDPARLDPPRLDPPRLDPARLALVPLAVVGLAYLLGRTDEFHLIPLAATLPVLLAGVATDEPRTPLRLLLLSMLLLICAHGLDRQAGQALHPPALADVPGPAGDGVQTSPADARALAGLLADVRALTAPGEPIFVANPRHDLVRVGDPLLYVILDRSNPTRYDVMQPGVVTTAAVQREIVRSLERSRTRVVVRWLDPTASRREPNGAGRSSGVHVLDGFLASAFRPAARFGYYQVLVRT